MCWEVPACGAHTIAYAAGDPTLANLLAAPMEQATARTRRTRAPPSSRTPMPRSGRARSKRIGQQPILRRGPGPQRSSMRLLRRPRSSCSSMGLVGSRAPSRLLRRPLQLLQGSLMRARPRAAQKPSSRAAVSPWAAGAASSGRQGLRRLRLPSRQRSPSRGRPSSQWQCWRSAMCLGGWTRFGGSSRACRRRPQARGQAQAAALASLPLQVAARPRRCPRCRVMPRHGRRVERVRRRHLQHRTSSSHSRPPTAAALSQQQQARLPLLRRLNPPSRCPSARSSGRYCSTPAAQQLRAQQRQQKEAAGLRAAALQQPASPPQSRCIWRVLRKRRSNNSPLPYA